MAKVFTIPVPPKIGRKRRERTTDPRYVDGQRLLVEAMKYLAQSDPVANRGAIELLSEFAFKLEPVQPRSFPAREALFCWLDGITPRKIQFVPFEIPILRNQRMSLNTSL